MVQLEGRPAAQATRSPPRFNSYMVQLEAYLNNVYFHGTIRFNSYMVQLEVVAAQRCREAVASFNSYMVQLEAAVLVHTHPE